MNPEIPLTDPLSALYLGPGGKSQPLARAGNALGVSGDGRRTGVYVSFALTVPPSWPGPTTAASQQVWDLYIILDMFAQHATGKMTANQAIAWAEKEMLEIYAGRKRRP